MRTSNLTKPLDFSYHPETYWENGDPIDAILADIKGEKRRHLVREALESGNVGDIPESALSSTLDEPERRDWGKIHPLYMGGEFLAADFPGETAIAGVAGGDRGRMLFLPVCRHHVNPNLRRLSESQLAQSDIEVSATCRLHQLFINA
jgi:hypothetical protein